MATKRPAAKATEPDEPTADAVEADGPTEAHTVTGRAADVPEPNTTFTERTRIAKKVVRAASTK